jgi:hypothetical protein
MILDFVFHSEEPLPDIVARAVEKGQAAIAPVGS